MPNLPGSLRRRLSKAGVSGRAIRVGFLGDPKARRGRLASGGETGTPVHAGSFLRERRIVLDAGLRERPRELARILWHELFHFAWVRLGNAGRWSYEELLRGELRQGARGELGWSAQVRKQGLGEEDVKRRTRRWREYACESFCDTGAWWLAPRARHPEYTLARRFREARRRWVAARFGAGIRC